MKKLLVLSITAMATLLSFNASAADILARVISSTPVMQQVAIPNAICTNQQVVAQAPKSGGGAILGALAGGALGNAFGNGSGRAVATMIGLVGGAVLGNHVEGSNPQVQNAQQCTTQTSYENRTTAYNVVYEFQGTQYSTQMAADPGQYVQLQVTPVDGINPTPQSVPMSYVQPVVSAPPQPVIRY